MPRFQKQIREGKSITLTHRDITRYFMSIPEAARLVIQAGAWGTGGDDTLFDAAQKREFEVVKRALKMLVPEYQPQSSSAIPADKR